ncbi:efflux RND transporter permease subunit, partial [Treponema sp. R80B11-R83G3]
VFIPIFLFKNRLGMMGEMFQGLLVTIGISLASSLLVAIFLVPVLASKFLPLETRKQKPLKNKLLIIIDIAVEKAINGLTAGYTRLLTVAVKHRLITVLLVVAAFAGSVVALPKLGMIMIPPMNEDSITLNVELPLGSKYDDTKAVMLQLQEIAIGEINGAKNIIVNVGSSGRAFGGGGLYKGELSVMLDMDNPEADNSAQAMN